jgi:hypothetical protein
MLYEKERELFDLSIQKWTSEEVFSFGWFLILGVLIVAYAIWLKLVDRSRGTELLLIGSLTAVAKLITAIILGNALGVFYYTIRLTPLISNVFATSVTISPIIVMLVQQYTSSWKGYLLWSAIGFAFLNFVIFPIYTLVGALEFHNWNVFYHFLVLYAISIAVRIVFLWITDTQKRHKSAA